MSLTNLGITPDPLVRNLFTLFLYVLTSLLLVFWGLTFSHKQKLSPKVVDYLHSLGAQITDFPSKFQNQFYSHSLTLQPQRLQLL